MHFFGFGAHSHAPAPCLREHSSAHFFSVPAYGWHSSPQCSSSASQLAGTPVPSAGPAGRPGGLSSSAGGTVCMVDCKFLRTRCNSDVTLVTCEWVRVNVYLKDSSMHCQRIMGGSQPSVGFINSIRRHQSVASSIFLAVSLTPKKLLQVHT